MSPRWADPVLFSFFSCRPPCLRSGLHHLFFFFPFLYPYFLLRPPQTMATFCRNSESQSTLVSWPRFFLFSESCLRTSLCRLLDTYFSFSLFRLFISSSPCADLPVFRCRMDASFFLAARRGFGVIGFSFPVVHAMLLDSCGDV